MPRYRVTINGRNFLIELEGRFARYGFHTSRFVEASDRAAAENAAVRMIRETQRLRDLVRNPPDDPPFMDVTSIDEIESLPPTEEREPGFLWYDENPRRWWRFWRR